MNGSRERDRGVDRWLRQSRHTTRRAGVTDSCLDPETLAAWMDGGLSGAALEMAQAHVADCARCQTLVGTVARINAVVPPAEQERVPRRWLAWLVPLTAAATAIALWVAVPRDMGSRLPQAPELPRQAAETSGQPSAIPNGQVQTGANEPAKEKQEQLAKKEAADSNQLRKPAPEARQVAGRLEADRLQPQPRVAEAGAQSAVAPPPAAPAVAPAPLLADKAVALARTAARAAEAPGIEIVSADPSVRWRIVRSVVQRSTDGGSRWDDVPTGVAGELTAGAAPSSSVCWIVGRGGLVLLSADGRNWRRVAFPEATDLSAVQATDARSASVSTADGRTFSTTDAGATWVLR